MSTLQQFCQWLYDQPAIVDLRESDQVFPLIETVHVLTVSLFAGTIVIVDLRLSGLLFRTERASHIVDALLPYTWLGFAIMTITGLPLFAAESAKLYGNPAFRLKLLLLALAAINAALFHRFAYRSAGAWAERAMPPLRVRAFAGISVLLWSAVIVAGRMIAGFRGH